MAQSIMEDLVVEPVATQQMQAEATKVAPFDSGLKGEDLPECAVKIKVFGIGGGGGNAVQHMINSGMENVTFCAANTDMQDLRRNGASVKVQLGEKLTKGLGAGADPNKGHEAALESINAIREAIGDADMVFVTAGMGGGTGTGAVSVIAQAAQEKEVLTVGVVTKPFRHEGTKRARAAEAGLAELKKHVDCLITIPNDRLLAFAPKKAAFKDMLQKANDVLYDAVRGISDVITKEGEFNLDFADVRTVMKEPGMALMGTGIASGEGRAKEAALKAIQSPLLEDISLDTAKAILYNITATDEVGIDEIAEIGDIIRDAVTEDANIIFGVVYDPEMGDDLSVTVIATGIEEFAHAEQVKPQVNNGRLLFPQPNEHLPRAPRTERVTLLGGGGQFGAQPQPYAQQPRDRVAEVGNWAGKDDPRPPYQRKQDYLGTQGQVSRHAPGQEDFTFDGEDFETPAFIRSQAD